MNRRLIFVVVPLFGAVAWRLASHASRDDAPSFDAVSRSAPPAPVTASASRSTTAPIARTEFDAADGAPGIAASASDARDAASRPTIPFTLKFVRAEDGGPAGPGEIQALVPGRTAAGPTSYGPVVARIDAGGAAEFDRAAPNAAIGVVVVEGRSIRAIRLPRKAAETIALRPSASLVVHVKDRSSDALAASAVAAALRISIVDDEALRPGIDIAPEDVGIPARRIAAVEADGTARFAELPCDVAIGLAVERSAAVVYKPLDAVLPLDPGERREVTLEFGDGAKVVATVLESDGRPCVGARVGLARDGGVDAPPGRDFVMLPAIDDPPSLLKSRTDDQGRAAFDGVGPGVYWACLLRRSSATERADASSDGAARTPVARRFVVRATDKVVDVALPSLCGKYVRGRCVGADGETLSSSADSRRPAPVVILLRAVDGSGGSTGQPAADGVFSIGPLLDVEYDLTTFSVRYAPVEPIRVRPDDAPVVVRLLAGASVAGRVVDPENGKGVRAEVFLSPPDGGEDVLGSTDGDGGFRFSGLKEGRYVIGVCDDFGRTGASEPRRLDVATPVEDLRIALTPKDRCGRVRVVMTKGVTQGRATLRQRDALRWFRFVGGAPLDTTVSVPPGEAEIRVQTDDGAVLSTRKVEVVRGETTVVRFEL